MGQVSEFGQEACTSGSRSGRPLLVGQATAVCQRLEQAASGRGAPGQVGQVVGEAPASCCVLRGVGRRGKVSWENCGGDLHLSPTT